MIWGTYGARGTGHGARGARIGYRVAGIGGFIIACCLLPIASLHGQQRYSFPTSLSADTRSTLTRLADSARALNIPTDPLVAKAAEGVLKNADETRIVRAVRTLIGELADARATLPASASPMLLNAAASALHAGVSRQTLSQLITAGAASEAELAVGLVAVADLAATGVPASRAGSAIEELLRRRAPESEITALRAAVARDVAAGRAAEAALGTQLDGLLRRLPKRAP